MVKLEVLKTDFFFFSDAVALRDKVILLLLSKFIVFFINVNFQVIATVEILLISK